MDYWVHVDGSKALWYLETTTSYYWAFGPLAYLGTGSINMYTASNTLKEKCPNNEGYVWNWIYFPASSGVATDDIYIKCANENDFCSSQNPCGTNQGDCDTHDECQDGLVCGSNNCPDSLGYHSEFDCCYHPTVGDELFCTNNNPCAIDEGDCDSDNECLDNFFCDTTSNCPAYLGFASDMNCCSSGSGCMS